MPEKKIIAVVGATGAQGGGLVRAILKDRSGGFRARALTRDVQSERAKELASLGADVVEPMLTLRHGAAKGTGREAGDYTSHGR